MASSNAGFTPQKPSGPPIKFQMFKNLPTFTKAKDPNYEPKPQSSNQDKSSASTSASGSETTSQRTNNTASSTESKSSSKTQDLPATESHAESKAEATAEKPTAKVTEKKNDEVKKETNTSTSSAGSSGASAASNTSSPHLGPIAHKKVDGNSPPSIAIIHMDPFISCLPEVYETVTDEIVIDYCEGYTDQCLKLIKEDYKDGRIFLLSSGGLARDIVPKIHDLPQLHAVYILCENIEGHKKWTQNYSKVRAVCFDEQRERFPQLVVDLARTYEDMGDGLAEVGKKKVAKRKYDRALQMLGKIPENYVQWFETLKQKSASCE